MEHFLKTREANPLRWEEERQYLFVDVVSWTSLEVVVATISEATQAKESSLLKHKMMRCRGGGIHASPLTFGLKKLSMTRQCVRARSAWLNLRHGYVGTPLSAAVAAADDVCMGQVIGLENDTEWTEDFACHF